MYERNIAAQDLNEGDVLIEDGVPYLVVGIHDRVSGVYVDAKLDAPVAGGAEVEFHFQIDEPVRMRSLA